MGFSLSDLNPFSGDSPLNPENIAERASSAVESSLPSWLPDWAREAIVAQVNPRDAADYAVGQVGRAGNDMWDAVRRVNKESARFGDRAYGGFQHVFGSGLFDDNYSRSLFLNTFSPATSLHQDYEIQRQNGLSSDEAWKVVGQHAGTTGEIAAAIVATALSEGGASPWLSAAVAGAGAAGGTALQGGDRGDILGAGAAGAVAGGLGGAAGQAAQGAAGTGTVAGAVAGGAASGAVSGGVGALIQDRDPLTGALIGAGAGAVSGGAGYYGGPIAAGAAGAATGTALSGGGSRDILTGAVAGGAAGATRPGAFNTPAGFQQPGGSDMAGYTDPATGVYYGDNGLAAGTGGDVGGGGFPYGAIAGGLLNLGSAYIQNEGIQDGLEAQTNAANNANMTNLAMYAQNREDLAPWRAIGGASINQLSQMFGPGGEWAGGFNPNTFETDPGYEFRLSEGQKALERSGASRGGALSGRAVKDAARFGQDYASNEYNNVFNRYWNDRTNRFNEYSNLAGLGQTAATNTVQAGQVAGQNTANLQLGIGGAQANAANQRGQLFGGVLNNVGNNIVDYYSGR